MTDLAHYFENNLSKLKTQRSNNDTIYQDINDYVLLNNSNFTTTTVQGERKDDQIFDDTAIHANEQLAAVLHSGLTDPTTRWFNLRPSIKEVLDIQEGKIWIKDIQEALFRIFSRSRSGFSQQNHEFFLSLGSYGTSVMWIGQQGSDIIFKTLHLSEIYIEEDHNGFVDTVYREFELTARQAAQEFGEENLGKMLLGALNKDPHKKFKFIHAVLPRADFERIDADNKHLRKADSNKEYSSVYVSCEDKEIVKTAGYHEMPYLVARWEKLAGEVYGRSPAWNSLSSILMVNAMQETFIRAGQKVADPAILASDDGVLMPLQTFPGGINIGGLSDDGRPLIQPLQTGARLDISFEMVEQVRDSIRRAFFVDQFADRRGVQPLTATESTHNEEKRLRLIGPQVRRTEDEYLTPLIDRAFGLAQRMGLLPDMPDAVRSKLEELNVSSFDFDVEYISPLAFTQRTNQLLSYNRAFANIGTFVEFDPTVMDNFDSDKIVRDAAEIAGIPVDQIRSEDDVAGIRESRAQQQQQEQQMAEIQAGAETAATLQKSGIDITGDL